jgi:hypothetical protein
MNEQSPSAWRVMQVIALAQQTLDTLRTEHGQVLEDEDSLRAALADEGASVDVLLSAIGRGILDARADVDAANARLDALCARRDRAARREERLRDTLLQALQAIGMSSFKAIEFGASWNAGKSRLAIVGEVPDDFTVAERKPVTMDIKAELERGPLPFAVWTTPVPVLTIRSK